MLCRFNVNSIINKFSIISDLYMKVDHLPAGYQWCDKQTNISDTYIDSSMAIVSYEDIASAHQKERSLFDSFLLIPSAAIIIIR